MAIDKIDQEFQQLMEVMDREQQMDDLLVAVKLILEAEKMPGGIERRRVVADALGMLIVSLPAAWASVAEANPDLTNDLERQGAVRVAMAMLLDLIPDGLALSASNAHC